MFREFTVEVPVFNREEYNILDFGAVPGGRVPCTEAFARAISKASEKGGRVIVPSGIFLTGPIVLKSGVDLHLEDNAVIIFTKNREDYPLMVTDFEGIRRIRAQSQISADHAENIAITGRGTINGNGHLWRPVKQWKMTERQWQELLGR